MNTQTTNGELVNKSNQLHRETKETLTRLEEEFYEVKNLYEKLLEVKIEYFEYEDMYKYFQNKGSGETHLHDELNQNFSKMEECKEWIKDYEFQLNDIKLEMIETLNQLIKE